MLKKYKEDHNGEKAPHEKVVEWEIIGILKTGQKVPAIKFVRENLLGVNGEIMSLTEAKAFVDAIVIKHNII